MACSACSLPAIGMNAAYEVRPMNGGTLFQASIATATSLRGKLTFTTSPFTSGVPPPVAAVSRSAAIGGAAAAVGGGPPAFDEMLLAGGVPDMSFDFAVEVV